MKRVYFWLKHACWLLQSPLKWCLPVVLHVLMSIRVAPLPKPQQSPCVQRGSAAGPSEPDGAPAVTPPAWGPQPPHLVCPSADGVERQAVQQKGVWKRVCKGDGVLFQEDHYFTDLVMFGCRRTLLMLLTFDLFWIQLNQSRLQS